MANNMADDLIGRVVEELRRQVPTSADFDACVMARVQDTRIRGEEVQDASPARLDWLAAAWSWLRRPRTLRVSPLGALGVVAAAVLLLVAGRVLAGRTAAGSRAVAAAPAARGTAPITTAASHGGLEMVRFVLLAPRAHSVAVAGDFNNWRVGRTMMRRSSAAGLWTVDVPLRPGRYTYTFVVDGTRWVPDPVAPREIADDFGAPSSVLAVPAREGGGA
ncbi:MAG TPA: isoamylase early set domain-containing protein [Gemmatimonadaceae bacterium]|nr:isoamylase early set domain-containing protein [Gemmatimonadaceae bacterium]